MMRSQHSSSRSRPVQSSEKAMRLLVPLCLGKGRSSGHLLLNFTHTCIDTRILSPLLDLALPYHHAPLRLIQAFSPSLSCVDPDHCHTSARRSSLCPIRSMLESTTRIALGSLRDRQRPWRPTRLCSPSPPITQMPQTSSPILRRRRATGQNTMQTLSA